MTVSERGVRTQRYWAMTFPETAEQGVEAPQGEAWYANRLIELLDDAANIRLRADVPVGAYLSGGLDSSVITALIQRRLGERLKTFSIGFESADFDETAFQSSMVAHLKTEHHPFLCRNADIGHSFEAAVWHAERPIIRTAPVPMMLLAKGVREEGIKVVLTGEGADEILAGYDIFKESKIRRFWARRPQSRLRPLLLKRLYPYLTGLQNQASAYLTAFFGQGLERTDDPFYSHRPRWQTTSLLKGLYSDDMRERLRGYDPVDELRQQLPMEFSSWHPLSQAQYLEAVFLLPGYILSSQGDRMAMAHAVEGRYPFLDHRVIEFASTIPPNLKLRRLREKHVLRKGAEHLLPETILNREKQPYRAPDQTAFIRNGKGLDYVEERLAPDSVRESGLFAPHAVQTLLAKCRRQPQIGVKDGMALAGSLSVQVLHQQFIKRKTETEVLIGKANTAD